MQVSVSEAIRSAAHGSLRDTLRGTLRGALRATLLLGMSLALGLALGQTDAGAQNQPRPSPPAPSGGTSGQQRLGPPITFDKEEEFLNPYLRSERWPEAEKKKYHDLEYLGRHPYVRDPFVIQQFCEWQRATDRVVQLAHKEIGQGPVDALQPGYRFTVIERPALYGIPQTAPLGVFSKSLQAKYPVGRPGFMIAGDEVIIRRILERVGPEITGDPMLWETIYEIEIPTQDNRITYFSSYFATQALPTGVDIAPHWFHAHRNFKDREIAKARKPLIDDLGIDPIWMEEVSVAVPWDSIWERQNCPPHLKP